MTAFSAEGLEEGFETALSMARHLDASDMASVTVARCLAARLDRLIAADEPVSAALIDAYCRALVRLGLMPPAGSRKTSPVTAGRLAGLRSAIRTAS